MSAGPWRPAAIPRGPIDKRALSTSRRKARRKYSVNRSGLCCPTRKSPPSKRCRKSMPALLRRLATLLQATHACLTARAPHSRPATKSRHAAPSSATLSIDARMAHTPTHHAKASTALHALAFHTGGPTCRTHRRARPRRAAHASRLPRHPRNSPPTHTQAHTGTHTQANTRPRSTRTPPRPLHRTLPPHGEIPPHGVSDPTKISDYIVPTCLSVPRLGGLHPAGGRPHVSRPCDRARPYWGRTRHGRRPSPPSYDLVQQGVESKGP